MADFCMQCSAALGFNEPNDLVGITKPEDWANGLSCVVLCEGCGPIQVDPDGRCISPNCDEGHNPPAHEPRHG